MKKLLGILVLGLLISGCATVPQESKFSVKDMFSKGTTKKTICKSGFESTARESVGGRALCHSFLGKKFIYTTLSTKQKLFGMAKIKFISYLKMLLHP